MTRRHVMPRRVFISYHHAGDQLAKDAFVRTFRSAFVDHSVRVGDIPDTLGTERIRQIIRDDHIRDATVTIVLVGERTWQRKHVDWEIDSSLRHTASNSRTGLLGILLPAYRPLTVARSPSGKAYLPHHPSDCGSTRFAPNNVPPRLWHNVKNRFGAMRRWPQSAPELEHWIELAFARRDRQPDPDLSYPTYSNNRDEERPGWEE